MNTTETIEHHLRTCADALKEIPCYESVVLLTMLGNSLAGNDNNRQLAALAAKQSEEDLTTIPK